ncbi:MAG: phosphate acetyltransferase [Neisseriaceae bacterium]|nr:phosphate acetyltransferase [Neisseriaceae bacterium]MBP6861585.1 phosphate acetyltransferase [Neisseriaceae bacterium]
MTVPVGTHQNLNVVTLALIEAIRPHHRVSYAKPIADKQSELALDYALSHGAIDQHPSLSAEAAIALVCAQAQDELLETIYGHLSNGEAEVLVLEGISQPQLMAQSIPIANTLHAGCVLAIDVKTRSAAEVATALNLAIAEYTQQPAKVVAFVLSNVAHEAVVFEAEVQALLTTSLPCLATYQSHTNQLDDAVPQLAQALNPDVLASLLAKPRTPRLSPPAFRHHLMTLAQKAHKRVVLPEGDEPRTIQAAVICHEKNIAHCVLLADPKAVATQAQSLGLTLPESLEIIDPASLIEQYVAPMVERRKSKGLTPAEAREQLQDSVVLGTMMLAEGDVDGLVSGAVHTTASTVRPALQLIKTAPNASLVSSVFFMLMPEQVLVFGDCAINPNPSPAQLADIAIQSAESALAFGLEAKVALISYSTGASGAGADVEAVVAATALAQKKAPQLAIDGPLQFDAACVPSVGKQKAPNSPVAGEATVFVFPDLNTGNTTYKAVQRSANVISVGPMLQGLNKPVNDLSRGALVDDIVYTIALTAIQAMQLANA